MMIALMKQEKKTLHPLKFVMYIACASIVMIFAGLSSAYIVKRAQANWLSYDIPQIFYYSTAVIIFSSFTLIMTRRFFLRREMLRYKRWLFISALLGVTFVVLQYIGFRDFWNSGFTLTRNVAFSFLYVIVGVHAVHVLGGAIAMVVMYIQSFRRSRKNYDAVYIDIMNTYWHFVDLLWIYLLVFFILIR